MSKFNRTEICSGEGRAHFSSRRSLLLAGPVFASALVGVPALANADGQQKDNLFELAKAAGVTVATPRSDESYVTYSPNGDLDVVQFGDLPAEFITAKPETTFSSSTRSTKGEDSEISASLVPMAGYHYSYNYKLDCFTKGATQAKAEVYFRKLKRNMAKTFPLGGLPNTIKKGATYNLKPGKNPVKVTAIGKDYFRFLSLPGHAEGAGKTITFQLHVAQKQYMLAVSATGPAASWQKNPIFKAGNHLFSYSMWKAFACKTSRKILGVGNHCLCN